jgi:hypothetical protein
MGRWIRIQWLEWKGKDAHRRPRFPAMNSRRGRHWKLTVSLLRFAETTRKTRTRCRRGRRARKLGRRLRFLPKTRSRCDWRRRWLRLSSEGPDHCEIEPKKCLSGCAGDRGKEGNRRESTELSVPGVFHRRWPDLLQHSGGKLHGLAASFQRGKERDERGGVGDL